MSSFVVSKIEYIKAAGLMHGIALAIDKSNSHFIRNVHKNFVECYELNVRSVNEQYGDNTLPDEEEYQDTFIKYAEIGMRIYNGQHMVSFNDLRYRLMKFFESCLYQIEDEEANKIVATFFYTCIMILFEKEVFSGDGWWGDIDV